MLWNEILLSQRLPLVLGLIVVRLLTLPTVLVSRLDTMDGGGRTHDVILVAKEINPVLSQPHFYSLALTLLNGRRLPRTRPRGVKYVEDACVLSNIQRYNQNFTPKLDSNFRSHHHVDRSGHHRCHCRRL